MSKGTGECSTWRSNLECSCCLNYLEGLHKQRMTHVLCGSGGKNRGKWIYITWKCWFSWRNTFYHWLLKRKRREIFWKCDNFPITRGFQVVIQVVSKRPPGNILKRATSQNSPETKYTLRYTKIERILGRDCARETGPQLPSCKIISWDFSSKKKFFLTDAVMFWDWNSFSWYFISQGKLGFAAATPKAQWLQVAKVYVLLLLHAHLRLIDHLKDLKHFWLGQSAEEEFSKLCTASWSLLPVWN